MLNVSGAGVLEVRPLAKCLPIIVKKAAPSFSVKYSPLFILVCSLQTGVSQYVDVTAEVHINGSRRFEEYAQTIHVVVGTNSWRMDGDFCSNCEATYWFTGNRIIEHTKITKMPETDGVELSEAEIERQGGLEALGIRPLERPMQHEMLARSRDRGRATGQRLGGRRRCEPRSHGRP
jgi:hypothetical protein